MKDKRIRHSLRKIIAVLVVLFALLWLVNWYMTYRLEDFLKEHLNTEVQEATDNYYKCSFSNLQIGLLTGELKINGLQFQVDSATYNTFKETTNLPSESYSIDIGSIHFKGINLTWLFDYRKLHFKKFHLKDSFIKIVSPESEYVAKLDSDTLMLNEAKIHLLDRDIYAFVQPYFDYIRVDSIILDNSSISFVDNDSIRPTYSLKQFNFHALSFNLDENSVNDDHLLFSESFNFYTKVPQTVFQSKTYDLQIGSIQLSTLDSIVSVEQFHLTPKKIYWDNRFTLEGDRATANLEALKIRNIRLKRGQKKNSFSARTLEVKAPYIEFVSVDSNDDEEDNPYLSKESSPQGSLYTTISPLFGSVSIDSILIDKARMQYSNVIDSIVDVYSLNRLDFIGRQFSIDSLSNTFVISSYLNDFKLIVDSLSGIVKSKNTDLRVGALHWNTENKALSIQHIKLAPYSENTDENLTYGFIDSINIIGLDYQSGISAHSIAVQSPKVEFTLNKIQSNKNKNVENDSLRINNLLNAVAPYISYLTINDIQLKNASLTLKDNIKKNTYAINSLDFFAKNFELNKYTRLFGDQIFQLDEYAIRFSDFDNLTPDKKYRIKIKSADFNSITGNMLLEQFSLLPEQDNKDYLKIEAPYVKLMALNEKQMRKKNLFFESLIFESPTIEYISGENKHVDNPQTISVDALGSLSLNKIKFDMLYIPNSSFFVFDKSNNNSLQVLTRLIQMDSLNWDKNQFFSISNALIDKPEISFVKSNVEQKGKYTSNKTEPIKFEDIHIKQLDIRQLEFYERNGDKEFYFKAEDYNLKGFVWNSKTTSSLDVKSSKLINPYIALTDVIDTTATKPKELSIDSLWKKIPHLVNTMLIGQLKVEGFNLDRRLRNVQTKQTDDYKRLLTNTTLNLEQVDIDIAKRKFEFDEVEFGTSNFKLPLSNGFYMLSVGNFDLSAKQQRISLSNIHLKPKYDKVLFTELEPQHKDWFNVEVGKVDALGIDFHHLIHDSVLYLNKLQVDKVLLENFKNKNFSNEPKIAPLFSQILMRVPLKYKVDTVDVKDFSVYYEELIKDGKVPGALSFTHMNGLVNKFTNIVTPDYQNFALQADGLAFNTAPFTATWTMPIHPDSTRFTLDTNVKNFNLTELNQLILPMAPVYVKSGQVQNLDFYTEADRLGGLSTMALAYDSLYVVITKGVDDKTPKTFVSRLVNSLVLDKQNNPDKKFRIAQDSVVRNPYKSNFNYFWQLMQPPMIESVGVSKKKQNFAKKTMSFLERIKGFFRSDKEVEKN